MQPEVACPKCQAQVTPSPVGFTWWGGALGPRMLHHVECPACHARFNGRSGLPNDRAIAIYVVVTLAVFSPLIYWVLTR
ncbi:MAG: hypothetical protein H6709_18185 [Kofleriaceae bacterium]|nr:hypothetical protein [Myxococcales bacterium]MCB9559331.1 hypothetical protein [Kofleriaceae bacterium]MCB9574015.1 hypothetical protein [Kofleriaceae bacterium]